MIDVVEEEEEDSEVPDNYDEEEVVENVVPDTMDVERDAQNECE